MNFETVGDKRKADARGKASINHDVTQRYMHLSPAAKRSGSSIRPNPYTGLEIFWRRAIVDRQVLAVERDSWWRRREWNSKDGVVLSWW
jgi:hypothetical protein